MDISPTKLAELIDYLRIMDAKEATADLDRGNDTYEDGAHHALESNPDDGTDQQIRGVIDGLDIDEKADLVALLWVGSGDFEPAEWAVARRRAGESLPRSVSKLLMGIPDVGDLLEEGYERVREAARRPSTPGPRR
jgi:hypothetical protein